MEKLKEELQKEQKLQEKAASQLAMQGNGTELASVASIPISLPKKNPLSTLRDSFWRGRSKGEGASKTCNRPPSAPASDQVRTAQYGEIDLQPYGFDLVLDFRWTRS